MRYVSLLFITFGLFLTYGCNNNKEEKAGREISTSTMEPRLDTQTSRPGHDEASLPPETRNPEPTNENEKDKILANIDQHLISKPDLAGGKMLLENTLPDATIIKAFAEVNLLDANGNRLSSNILIFENIRPGESKAVRISNTTGAVTVSSHVLKIKSNELTDGETIIVGSHYSPK
jgi:hypothetical protein